MATFHYQALTKDEELRTGEIVAPTAAAAHAELESQGLNVLLVRQSDHRNVSEPTVGPPRSEHEPTAVQLLRERVALLLEQRSTLGPALAAFADELPRGRTRRELKDLVTKIQNGEPVDRLTEEPMLVRVWLPLVGSTSTLGSGQLQHLFVEAQRDYENRAHLARSLAYPAVVVLLALAVLVFLGVFVVPTFTDIFNDFDLELPSMTLVVVKFSELLTKEPLRLLAIVIVVGLLAWGMVWLVRNWVLPGRWLGVILDGNSTQVAEMAFFVRRLAESLNMGLPLGDTLLLIGRNVRFSWLRKETDRLYAQLASGADPRSALENSSLPATVSYALAAGPEETPHVGLLQTIADVYSERVSNRFKWASGFLPQLAMVCIGLVVAMVVVALFMPLVMLINGLAG